MVLVRFFDFIGERMGQAFGIVFKIIIPLLVTALPIDRVCAFTLSRFGIFADVVAIVGFLLLLIFHPKIASVAEFIIIGFALIFTIGFKTIHAWWAWAAMAVAMVFLFFKILFLFSLMVKRAAAMDAADAEELDEDLDEDTEALETNTELV